MRGAFKMISVKQGLSREFFAALALVLAMVLTGCATTVELPRLVQYAAADFPHRDPRTNAAHCELNPANTECRADPGAVNPDYLLGSDDALNVRFCHCETYDTSTKKCTSVRPAMIQAAIPGIGGFAAMDIGSSSRALSMSMSILGALSRGIATDTQKGKLENGKLEFSEPGGSLKVKVDLQVFQPYSSGIGLTSNSMLSWNKAKEVFKGAEEAMGCAAGKFKFGEKEQTHFEISLSQRMSVIPLPGDELIIERVQQEVTGNSRAPYGYHIISFSEQRIDPAGRIWLAPSGSIASWGQDFKSLEEKEAEGADLRAYRQFLDTSGYYVQLVRSDLKLNHRPTLSFASSCLAAAFDAVDGGGTHLSDFRSQCINLGFYGDFGPIFGNKDDLSKRRYSLRLKRLDWTLVDEQGTEHTIDFLYDQPLVDAVRAAYQDRVGRTLVDHRNPARDKAALTVVPGRLTVRARTETESMVPFWGWVQDGSTPFESAQPLLYPGDRIFVTRVEPRAMSVGGAK